MSEITTEPKSEPKKAANKKGAKRTNLESSVRLSAATRKRYEEMARENRTQKTAVLETATLRMAERLTAAPTLFKGDNRPWVRDAKPSSN